MFPKHQGLKTLKTQGEVPKHLNFQTNNWEAVVAVEVGNLKQNLPVFW